MPFHCWRNWHESFTPFEFLLIFYCSWFGLSSFPIKSKPWRQGSATSHRTPQAPWSSTCLPRTMWRCAFGGVDWARKRASLRFISFVFVVCVCVCVYATVCADVYLSLYLSIYLSIYRSVYTYLSIDPPIYLSIYRSIYLVVVLPVVTAKGNGGSFKDRKL